MSAWGVSWKDEKRSRAEQSRQNRTKRMALFHDEPNYTSPTAYGHGRVRGARVILLSRVDISAIYKVHRLYLGETDDRRTIFRSTFAQNKTFVRFHREEKVSGGCHLVHLRLRDCKKYQSHDGTRWKTQGDGHIDMDWQFFCGSYLEARRYLIPRRNEPSPLYLGAVQVVGTLFSMGIP